MSIPEAESFLARGILMKTLLALQAQQHQGPLTTVHTTLVFPGRE